MVSSDPISRNCHLPSRDDETEALTCSRLHNIYVRKKWLLVGHAFRIHPCAQDSHKRKVGFCTLSAAALSRVGEGRCVAEEDSDSGE
jgi:hypothetical protein